MIKKSIFWVLTVCLFLGLAGCYNDALDPTQLGRFEPTPTVNVILDTLGVADEPSPTYEGAEEPSPEDLIAAEPDYVFSPGDAIAISIFELYNEGIAFQNRFVVTESGRISIPDVGVVRAEGLTEVELEREIASILSPNIIKNPSVTVTLLNSEHRVFSIIGQGIAQAGRYALPRKPTRLTEVIAIAGNIGDFNVSHIYVSRDVKTPYAKSFETPPSSEPVQGEGVEDQMLEMISPSAHGQRNSRLVTTAEMAARSELESLAAPEGIDPLDELIDVPDTTAAPSKGTASRIEWVFEEGQWKAIEVQAEPADSPDLQLELLRPEQFGSAREAAKPQMRSDFGLSDLGDIETMTRVIEVPVDKLLSGDPRYNIIVQPGDSIIVPRDLVGEFWVAGNVNAPNAYPITGRPITLKQAIATAGGLNAIAWPSKVEVVRRIGKNKAGLLQEEIVLVDLAKIAKGTQPDFFIKPYDYINVGTHGTSRWLAVLRNAFRATYGFGLIYDRNFAQTDWDPLRSYLN